MLSISADDRTGAYEVAGMCAAASGGAVTVSVGRFEADPGAAITVADLASRHLTPTAAIERVLRTKRAVAARHAHKMDSLLRGNWAHELLALTSSEGPCERALVVPAFPALGRTCVGGVVSAVDAHGEDAREAGGARRSARPSDHLRDAGAPACAQLQADSVREWLLVGTDAVGVCDASTDDDLAEIARAWASSDGVLLASTAAGVAAGAAAFIARAPTVPPPPAFPREVLVVCGSLHPVAREQLRHLREATGEAEVLVTDLPAVLPVAHAGAQLAASALAARVHGRLAVGDVGTVVIIGGDTAEAVIGDAAMRAGGVLAPGVPWLRSADGSGPLIVTRAGSFGDRHALAALIADGIARRIAGRMST